MKNDELPTDMSFTNQSAYEVLGLLFESRDGSWDGENVQTWRSSWVKWDTVLRLGLENTNGVVRQWHGC